MANLAPFGNRSLFDEFFRDFAPGYYIKPLHGDALPAQIKVDVSESASGYTVKAEIPGVSKDDIHVAIDGGVVTLSAEVRQEDRETKDEKVLRSERYYGKVYRAFALGQDIDEGATQATYADGILELKLAKKASTSAKRITIQ